MFQNLVETAVMLRPNRLILDGIQDKEVMTVLEAITAGHDGTLISINADRPHNAICRLERMFLRARPGLPVSVVQEHIAESVDLICQISRLRDGSRKITAITEIQGIDKGKLKLVDIFKYEQVEHHVLVKILGSIRPTGIRPQCIDRIEDAGIHLPSSVFGIVQHR